MRLVFTRLSRKSSMNHLLWAVYEIDERGDFILPRIMTHPQEYKRYVINKLFHVMKYSKIHGGIVLSIDAKADASIEIPKILNYCFAVFPQDPDPKPIHWSGIILGESAMPLTLCQVH